MVVVVVVVDGGGDEKKDGMVTTCDMSVIHFNHSCSIWQLVGTYY